MNPHKILLSLAAIVFAGGVVAGGTGAFFSDAETSAGNTFTSGAIDLTVDSVAHYNGHVCTNGEWALEDPAPDPIPDYPKVGDPCGGTWTRTDLGPSNRFFEYGDLKPGDNGENTISLHVENNEAWSCAYIQNVTSDDNGITEPEGEAGDASDGAGYGELKQEVNFFAWDDDGDNIWESGEQELFSNVSGTAVERAYPLFTPQGGVSDAPMMPGQTQYIGLYWCYGQISVGGNTLTCNGQPVTNVSQTDTMTADITFYTEQSRNNPGFTCPGSVAPDTTGDRRMAVGADLGDYQAPGQACAVTVAVGESIQTALDDVVTSGQTVCVGPGTHSIDTYPLHVRRDGLTLASTDGAAATTLGGGVILDNDGTKVKGFTLGHSTDLGETFGVYINTGADGVEVSFNEMNGPGSAVTSRGVVSAIGVSNATIANNDISAYLSGVFLNGSTNMIVELNTLSGNGVGSANDNPDGNIVRKNQITGNTLEGVGVLSTGGESISVTQNNIFGNGGAGNELNSYALDAVAAENNWWGDVTPADEIGGVGAAQVDYTPFELTPLALN